MSPWIERHSTLFKTRIQDRKDLSCFLKGGWGVGGGYLRIHACIWLKTITPLEGQVIKKKIKTDLSAEKDAEKHCSGECNKKTWDIVKNDEQTDTWEQWKKTSYSQKIWSLNSKRNSHVDAAEAWKVQRVEVQPEALVHLPTCTTDLTHTYNHFEHYAWRYTRMIAIDMYYTGLMSTNRWGSFVNSQLFEEEQPQQLHEFSRDVIYVAFWRATA